MIYQFAEYAGLIIAIILILMGGLYTIGGFFRYSKAIDLNLRHLQLRNMPVKNYELLAILQIIVGIALLLTALFILNW